jgi:hypothetical protein
MSDLYVLSTEEVSRAIKWTEKRVTDATVAQIPLRAFREYPGLANYAGRLPSLLNPAGWLKVVPNLTAFVLEVANVQEDAAGKAGPVDGCLGTKTLDYLFHTKADGLDGWVHGGRRVAGSYLGDPPHTRITFQDDPFWRLDKHSDRGGTVCRFIVVHWGGKNPRSLQNYFAGTERAVSSHGSVGYDSDGSVIATQTVDLEDSAWHGGWINRYSVGMDIAFSPEVSNAEYGKALGWPINIIDNPTNRGDAKVVDLPEELADATAWLLCEWATLLGIPMEWVSRDPAALLGREEVLKSAGGFIMHSQFAPNKWDCAPWGQRLMDATDKVSRLIRS